MARARFLRRKPYLLDDILTSRPGGIIRQKPGYDLVPEEVTSEATQYAASVLVQKEKRKKVKAPAFQGTIAKTEDMKLDTGSVELPSGKLKGPSRAERAIAELDDEEAMILMSIL